jgi:hypothetical protein
MNLVTIIAVLLISLLFTVAFVAGMKSRGPWGSAWSFFSIVCLSLAAVSLWIPPAGPLWMGAPWLDLIATGLLVSFVLSAMSGLSTTSNKSHSEKGTGQPSDKSGLSTREANEIKYEKYDSAAQNSTAANNPLRNKGSLNYEQMKVRIRSFIWLLLLCPGAHIVFAPFS